MSQMTQNSFAELSLCGATQRAIAEVLRYETMTKVQVHAIPPALAGAFSSPVRHILFPPAKM